MTQRPSEGIGKRLAKYRKLAGLSAQGLSDRLAGEMSRGVIANIESGRKQDLTVDQLVMLSAALGIPPVVLALPVEEPEAMVRVIGMEQYAAERHSVRSHLLISWFMNEKSSRLPVEEFGGLGMNVANQTLKAVDEYYWAAAHYRVKLSKEVQDEDATLEAKEDLERAQKLAESLGVSFESKM